MFPHPCLRKFLIPKFLASNILFLDFTKGGESFSIFLIIQFHIQFSKHKKPSPTKVGKGFENV